MTCSEYDVLLQKLLDGEADPAEEALIRRHEAACPACLEKHAAQDALQQTLADLAEVPPMPTALHQAWLDQVEECAMEDKQARKQTRSLWPRMLATAAALVFIVGGTLMTRDTLGGRSTQPAETAYRTTDTADSADYAMPETATVRGADNVSLYMAESSDMSAYDGSTADTGVTEDKKIIRTADMTLSTRAFDDDLTALVTLCDQQGGWISYQRVSGSEGKRTADLTLRIPAEKLDDFLAGAGSIGTLTSRQESATDVTADYQDTAARLATQQALMARLQALVTNAADLSDLLALESQIADTQYTIDRLQSSLNATDRQVDYAEVGVTLREATDAAIAANPERTLGERIVSALSSGFGAFVDFLADAAVFLVAALPFLAVAFAAWLVIHLIRKHNRNHKEDDHHENV